MSVYCAATDCKHNGNRNRCMANCVTLSWHSVMTLWEGRQEFCRCKSYEMSDESKRICELIKKAEESE